MTKKTCSMQGCNWPLFARGYCSSHYRSEYLSKKDPIKKRTPKREGQEYKYRTRREIFIDQYKKYHGGKIFCIFCGKPVYNEPSLHHGLGRDDETLLDEKFWFLTHNSCHVEEYHGKSWEDISWWNGYIDRIKHIPEILEKEQLRMSKS